MTLTVRRYGLRETVRMMTAGTCYRDVYLDEDARTVQHGDQIYSVVGADVSIEEVGELRRRVTATRLLAGGLVLGLLAKKKVSDRVVVLSIIADAGATVVEAPAKERLVARKFAARVSRAARG